MRGTTFLLVSLTGFASACVSAHEEPWERWLEDRDEWAEGVVAASYDSPNPWARLGSGTSGLESRRHSGLYTGGVVTAGGTEVYDVSDLVQGLRDFPAPVIGDLRRPEDRPEREEGYADPEPRPLVSEDVLIDMVRSALGPDGEDAEVRIVGGRLFVNRNP